MAPSQRQTGWSVNVNPAGLAPIVNPRSVEIEQVDFAARITAELEALNEAVDAFNSVKQQFGLLPQWILAGSKSIRRMTYWGRPDMEVCYPTLPNRSTN